MTITMVENFQVLYNISICSRPNMRGQFNHYCQGWVLDKTPCKIGHMWRGSKYILNNCHKSEAVKPPKLYTAECLLYLMLNVNFMNQINRRL